VDQTRRLLVVLNPSAGGARGSPVERALTVLRAGADVQVVRPSGVAEGRAALAVAVRESRAVVVVGGDGTLHGVISLLSDLGALSATVVGLVPLGTGNDFARSLGVPLHPEEAARALLAGQARDLELITDDAGGVAVNAVHLGAGAEAARAAGRWKARLGPLAFPVGAAIAGLRPRGWRLHVVADGEVLADVDRRVLMVALTVGRTIGGGAPLAPDADPGDGLAEVVVSEATGPVARLGYALHLRRGAHGARSDVRTTRAHSVTVSGEPYPVNADGEVAGPIARRTWTVRPRAWRFLAPAAPLLA
jgi:diacylglycerol kinase family enzyme